MDEILIPVVAILMPLVLVPTVMLLRQAGRRREWEHRERMKALELGVPVPGSHARASRVAIAVGAVMPVGVFAIAWLASLSTGEDDVWIAAGLVGLAGVVGGVRLAGRIIGPRPSDEPTLRPGDSDRGASKPEFEPDAYEEIVRHG